LEQDNLIKMVYGNEPKIKFVSTENQSEFNLNGNIDTPLELEIGIYN